MSGASSPKSLSERQLPALEPVPAASRWASGLLAAALGLLALTVLPGYLRSPLRADEARFLLTALDGGAPAAALPAPWRLWLDAVGLMERPARLFGGLGLFVAVIVLVSRFARVERSRAARALLILALVPGLAALVAHVGAAGPALAPGALLAASFSRRLGAAAAARAAALVLVVGLLLKAGAVDPAGFRSGAMEILRTLGPEATVASLPREFLGSLPPLLLGLGLLTGGGRRRLADAILAPLVPFALALLGGPEADRLRSFGLVAYLPIAALWLGATGPLHRPRWDALLIVVALGAVASAWSPPAEPPTRPEKVLEAVAAGVDRRFSRHAWLIIGGEDRDRSALLLRCGHDPGLRTAFARDLTEAKALADACETVKPPTLILVGLDPEMRAPFLSHYEPVPGNHELPPPARALDWRRGSR